MVFSSINRKGELCGGPIKQGQVSERVSAADFVRGFANLRAHSVLRPVVVTHHGEDAHVLISLDDYRRLGCDGDDTGDATLQASQILLLESIRDALVLIDRERRITTLNPAASDMFEIAAAALIGQSPTAALPMIETSCIFPHVLRMLDHRERYSGELPSLLRPGQWLRADLVPLPAGGAIILRDVTEAIAARASVGAQHAVIRAINVAGGIGQALVSVRETVEYANDALIRTIGVCEEAICRVRFSALLPLAARQQFSEALETLFRTGAPGRFDSELVSREGLAVPVTLSIVERRGAYGSEGAAVLVTPRVPTH